MMVEQFRYRVAGKRTGGGAFDTELLVIAANPDDAEDEAISCIDSFESVTDWTLTPDGSVPADEDETRMYLQRGPFAVFDPAVLHERG